MNIVTQLERLHREIPGCQAVVFGDLRTQTVLRSLADDSLCQEDRDRLLADAAVWLHFRSDDSRESGPPRPVASIPPTQVTVRGRDSTRVFLLLCPRAPDAVCILARAETPVAEIQRALQSLVLTDD